jgi:hypothetical protein
MSLSSSPDHDEFAAVRHHITEQMRGLVLRAARARGKVEFSTPYADNHWRIKVRADGTVRNDGYAEVARGRESRLEALQLWELARLVQAL